MYTRRWQVILTVEVLAEYDSTASEIVAELLANHNIIVKDITGVKEIPEDMEE